ncbi:hypothetical protein [Aureimonas sp. AU20]|uniref:hypothetical protein n=1 Tax=Aureimonas sp. AU20 TaxID=1349819 RepID=UPI0007229ACC|nr:hypothetical protein [Aureimonas sp. AU20]ALN75818.1 hypothetical protein M673_23995 [Aureimonas sp. AU20]
MSNRTVPAAAEGLPAETFHEVERLAGDAEMFARVADMLAGSLLSMQADKPYVRISNEEADVLLFATLNARLAASAVFAAVEKAGIAEDAR